MSWPAFFALTGELLLCCAIGLYTLWFFYLAVMSLKRASDAKQLSFGVSLLAVPGVAIAFALDWLANWLLLTPLLLELPRELLVTKRLSRHLQAGDASRLGRWRTWLAKLVCTQLLDKFDPSGQHCKCKGCEPLG